MPLFDSDSDTRRNDERRSLIARLRPATPPIAPATTTAAQSLVSRLRPPATTTPTAGADTDAEQQALEAAARKRKPDTDEDQPDRPASISGGL